MRESSEDFLIYIFPKTALTASEKESSILLLTKTLVSLSEGLEFNIVGGLKSIVEKLNVAESFMPKNELPEISSKAEESICI